MRLFCVVLWLALLAATPLLAVQIFERAAVVNFAADVRPIFAKNCVSCHGPDKQRGGLRLDQRANGLRGGESGAAFIAGKAADSLLIRLVTEAESGKFMPPTGERLTAAEIAKLRTWIDQGAKWPDDGSAANDPADWWSFRPMIRPTVSATQNPIDQLIRTKLQEKGLTPTPEANRRTLIRRVYFDLIGLPPTFEEIEAFQDDVAPNAFEKVVDRLLASPHYGERWARHWLDVVHFGETHGYDKDKPRLHAWPYRDYVIRSLNADKPYARFVMEQIAGDVLFPGTVDGIEMLGFLAAGPWDFIGHVELPESKIDGRVARHLDRDDFVSNTISTFLSLTVHCAQCHNHKFDPISQVDYYALQAVFASIDRTDRKFDADPAVANRRTRLEAQRQALQPKYIGPETLEEATARAPVESELRNLPPQRIAYVGAVHHGSGNFVGTGPQDGKPRIIRVLPRGDVTKPGQEVGPGAIAAIPGLSSRFDLPAGHSESARRAALAHWLTDVNNPLLWRSIANRVWQYHFGRGIVDTANDFGRMGQLPTHPELLDWLATELRDNGGSLKKFHRMIVTSATYRQAADHNADNARVDADNRFLWRQNRRKLEAEAVRDTILMVAGKLDRTLGGPSFQDFVIDKPEHSPHYQYQLQDPNDPKTLRRSIYRFIVRSKQQPFMAALDCADPSLAVGKRIQTITPQQALALFNNRLTLSMAEHLAARVEKLAHNEPERVTTAFRLALGREPSATERDSLSDYVREHGLANACRLLFNLNEFVFVD